MTGSIRKEMDSLGDVNVPDDKLWGAQTQRSLEHFSIGKDLILREIIKAYATLKKAKLHGLATRLDPLGARYRNARGLIGIQIIEAVAVCALMLPIAEVQLFPL
jgi:fumarate hydratase class II